MTFPNEAVKNATVIATIAPVLESKVAITRRFDTDPVAITEVNMSERLAMSGREEGRLVERGPSRDVEIERIRAAVKGIRFGEVRIIIQDGLVIQIERIEKERLR